MSSLTARVRSHTSIPLYRSAYALIISGGAVSVLGIVYWALATRLFAPEVVGRSSSAVAALTFLAGLSSLYLDGSLIRFLPRAGVATRRIVISAYAVAITLSAAVALVFVAGIDLWAPRLAFLASDWAWIAATVGATIGLCLYTLQDAVLTGIRRTGIIPIENTTYAVAKILLLLALVGTASEAGILTSFLAPLLLIILPVSALLVRLLPRHVAATAQTAERITRNQIARYSLGNYVGFLFLLAYLNLPPLLVLNIAGSEASAFFYLPWTIATTLRLLTGSMSVSLIVEGTIDAGNVNLHVRRAVLQVGRLLLPIVGFLVLAAPWALQVFGERYATEGTTLLRLLALGAIPNAVCIIAFGVARLQDRVWAFVAGQSSLAVLLLSLIAALLPTYGIEGVGVAWIISQSVVALVMFATILLPLRGRGRGRGRSGETASDRVAS